MTNTEKFSPAWGFEAGVVVEVADHKDRPTVGHFVSAGNRYFNHPEGKHDFIVLDTFKGWQDFRVAEIKSLRILSGPWAVWQFAPKGAIGAELEDNSPCPIMFFNSSEKYQALKDHTETGFVYLDAPWWWLEGQKQ